MLSAKLVNLSPLFVFAAAGAGFAGWVAYDASSAPAAIVSHGAAEWK